MASKYEEKKDAFAVMRANGLLLREIAEHLGISQRTAERWSKDEYITAKVKQIKAQHLEELQQVCEMTREERIKNLTQTIAQIDEAITEKNIKQMPPGDLLALKLRYIKALREEQNEW